MLQSIQLKGAKMLHYYISNDNSGEHFAVSHNTVGSVLVQLGDKSGEQIRVMLTPEDARFMAQKLLKMADISDENLKDRYKLYLEENDIKKYIKQASPITWTNNVEEAKVLLNWTEIHLVLDQYKIMYPDQELPEIDRFREENQTT